MKDHVEETTKLKILWEGVYLNNESMNDMNETKRKSDKKDIYSKYDKQEKGMKKEIYNEKIEQRVDTKNENKIELDKSKIEGSKVEEDENTYEFSDEWDSRELKIEKERMIPKEIAKYYDKINDKMNYVEIRDEIQDKVM